MLTAPSLQKKHGICWSRDPALRQPDDPIRGVDESDADYERRKKEVADEWQRDLERARETGDWRRLLKDGQQPTVFQVAPMKGETTRVFVDHLSAGKVGVALLSSLAFRACVQSVENLGDVKIKFDEHADYGRLADAEIVDVLDEIDPKIVAELGGYCWTRALKISPK